MFYCCSHAKKAKNAGRWRKEKSKPCVMSNFCWSCILLLEREKKVMGKEREGRKEKFVVTSSGTLFCRLWKKETEGGSGEEEAIKWDQLID